MKIVKCRQLDKRGKYGDSECLEVDQAVERREFYQTKMHSKMNECEGRHIIEHAVWELKQ